MNKKAILLTSLALLLAACGSTSTTPSVSPDSSPSTSAADSPAATPIAAAPADSAAPSLAAQLGLNALNTLALPDLSTVQREAGDSSASDIIVSYRDLSDVQTLAAHLGASLGGVIPELHAALLNLPGNLSGMKVALSVSSGGGRLSAQLNGHSAELSPVSNSGDQSALSSQSVRPLDVGALADSDPLSPKQWWIRQVSADQVRGIATGKGVTVGVVDSDFDRLHEDLIAPGKIATGIDTTDVSTEKLLNPTDPLTNGSHGSGSAGIIGERIGNGVGGAGVAPDTILMPIRIFNPGFTGSFNVAYGMVWAVNHGAQILNNSWGGGGYDQLIKDAVDYALLKNVTVVGSAGNDNSDFQTGLAAFTGVISAGASGGNDYKVDFSTFGPRVDLFAPGDQGLSTEIDETLAPPNREKSYGLFNGTSMAGPVIAGGAALLIDRAAQKGLTGTTALTPYQIKRLLADNGDPMKDPRTPGFKRLNVAKSLSALDAAVPADGATVAVQVSDLVTGNGIDLSDVILTPLSGQNKGQDYLSQTSSGGVGLNSKGKFGSIFPAATDPGLNGVAVFSDIEPGDYKVQVGGSGAFGYAGSRTLLSGRITVKSGDFTVLKYQHQVDFFEYTAKGRNGAPASATDLDALGGATALSGALLGGTFDNAYVSNSIFPPAFPGAPANTPDQDFYKVTIPAGKTLSVISYASKFGSKSVAKVEIVDASGAAVAGATSTASAATASTDYTASYKAAAATVVYLKFSSANGSYGLGSWYGDVLSVK